MANASNNSTLGNVQTWNSASFSFIKYYTLLNTSSTGFKSGE